MNAVFSRDSGVVSHWNMFRDTISATIQQHVQGSNGASSIQTDRYFVILPRSNFNVDKLGSMQNREVVLTIYQYCRQILNLPSSTTGPYLHYRKFENVRAKVIENPSGPNPLESRFVFFLNPNSASNSAWCVLNERIYLKVHEDKSSASLHFPPLVSIPKAFSLDCFSSVARSSSSRNQSLSSHFIIHARVLFSCMSYRDSYNSLLRCIQASNADPNDKAIAFDLIGWMCKEGKGGLNRSYEDAEKCYLKGIEHLSPFQNRIRVHAGLACKKQRKLAQAVSFFSYVIKHEKEDKVALSTALKELAYIRYSQGEYFESFNLWKCIEANGAVDGTDNLAKAYSYIAGFHRFGYGVEQSVEEVEKYALLALQQSPISPFDKVAAYNHLGWVCLVRENHEEAVKNFDRAVEVRFLNEKEEILAKGMSHFNLFNLYHPQRGFKRGLVTKALEHGEQALLSASLPNKQKTDLHFRMGEMYRYDIGSFNDAYNHFSAANRYFLTEEEEKERQDLIEHYRVLDTSRRHFLASYSRSSSSSISEAT